MLSEDLISRPLLLEFLTWVDRTPRSYRETMDAWRTSCPRFSIWEDAWLESLVAIEVPAGGEKEEIVRLTGSGRALLDHSKRQEPMTREPDERKDE